MENPVRNVSDTAWWVAMHRAWESERPDAAFRDPLARRLAGERGAAIAAALPHAPSFAFAVATRTAALDRLVEAAIARGVDTVINLGAGLDTRPYRMRLPPGLHWIEVDLPEMIAYKESRLAGERPVCRLRRETADLSDDAARAALFARLGADTRKAAILTEGLITYLTPDQVSALARDLHATPAFAYWILNYARGRLRNHRHSRAVRRHLGHQAPWLFNVDDPLGFLAGRGWRVREDIGMLDEAERIGRRPPFLFPWSLLGWVAPGIFRKLGNRTYGHALLEKAVAA